MGRYWAIRGFLDVGIDELAAVRAVLDGFRNRGEEFGLTAGVCELYLRGWVVQGSDINGSVDAFYGAAVQSGGRDLVLAQLRELARIPDDDGDFTEGRFFVTGEEGWLEQWLVAHGAVHVDVIREENGWEVAAEVAFVAALVHAHHRLLPVLDGHLGDHAVVLPHLLLADVEHWVELRYASHGAGDADLRALLVWLDREYETGVPRIRELVAASFLELLSEPGEPASGLVDLLGPALRVRLDAIRG